MIDLRLVAYSSSVNKPFDLNRSISFSLASRDCGTFEDSSRETLLGRIARKMSVIRGDIKRLSKNQPKPLLFLLDAKTATNTEHMIQRKNNSMD